MLEKHLIWNYTNFFPQESGLVIISFFPQESGLVIISSEEGQFSLSKCSDLSDISVSSSGAALISQDSAEILQKAGEGTLGKSTQVKVPDSKQNVVNVGSVAGTQGKVQKDNTVHIPEQNSMHVNVETAVQNAKTKEVDKSDSKEQITAHISVDSTENKTETDIIKGCIKDANSNEIKQDTIPISEDLPKDHVDSDKTAMTNLTIDQADSTHEDVNGEKDSKCTVVLDLVTDDETTSKTATENTEQYGLSNSIVTRLEKMTEGAAYKQGLCQSISFESDVTYHHESEDELMDTEETDSIDTADKLSKIEHKDKKASFRIGDGTEDQVKSVSSSVRVEKNVAAGSATDQYVEECSYLSYKQSEYMNPVESVDDVSSMLVDYDPNETVSIGDYTEDKLEDVKSSSSSEEEGSEYNAGVGVCSVEQAENSKVLTLADRPDLAVVGASVYDPRRFLNPTQSYDDVSSMMVEYDPNETVSVSGSSEDSFEDAVDNSEMTVGNVEKKDYVPGNFSTIDYWVRSVSREEADVNVYVEDANKDEVSVKDEEKVVSNNDSPLEMFAREYVDEIVESALRSVSLTPVEMKRDSNIGQSVGSSETSENEQEPPGNSTNELETNTVTLSPLNISTPSKKSISEDVVLPLQKPLEVTSVDNLSPIKHVTEDTPKDGVEFFSYKLQTQASVVLSSKEDGTVLEEQDEVMSPVLSDIPGYGVCLSGEGMEEMEKYYKEMAMLADGEKQKGQADDGEMNQNSEMKEELSESVKKDASEKEELVKVTEGENNGSISEDVAKVGIIDDWAKKDYRAASGHTSEDSKLENDNSADARESITTGDDGTGPQKTTFEASNVEDTTNKGRNASVSSESGAVSKRKKGKKSKPSASGVGKGSSVGDRRSSAETRSSTSDLDKRSSGSLQSSEADLEEVGRKSTKKKSKDGKDGKDENCSVA